jgi:hypothetical protein
VGLLGVQSPKKGGKEMAILFYFIFRGKNFSYAIEIDCDIWREKQFKKKKKDVHSKDIVNMEINYSILSMRYSTLTLSRTGAHNWRTKT